MSTEDKATEARELENRALVAALTGAPFHYSPTEAENIVREERAMGILGAAAREGEPGNVGIILALANRVAAQAELLAARAARPAKTSEPAYPNRYFVCAKCNDAFAFLKGDAHATCACGAVEVEGSPLTSELTTVKGGGIDVTQLVACGKLSVALGGHDGRRVVFSVCNKNARGIEQRKASEAVEIAADQVRRHAGTALDYLEQSARAGAHVAWQSHYHTERAGVEKTEAGEFQKRQFTGDARFCGFVVARRQENTRDDALVFQNVRGCARCGGNHEALPFWRMTNPVAGGGVPLTHFAHCPNNGEPILLFFTENKEAERIQEGRDVKPIEHAKPIGGPSATGIKTVAGTSTAYNMGYDAGFADSFESGKQTQCPFADQSTDAAEWHRGYKNGYKP